jgi:hypothetical protein
LLLVPLKGMLWRPFAQTKVDDDVLTGDPRSRVDSPSMNLLYPGRMMAETLMLHAPGLLPGELVEPSVQLLKRCAKGSGRLGTELVEEKY